jgi:Escherichia/Staphylococcus phage prohead protease
MMNGALEVRSATELRASSAGRLEGYAAVFGKPSQDLGGFTESVRPGAFTRSLASPAGILALYDHDTRSILGRVGAGTLRLMEDTRGLQFEIDLPDTTVGKDLSVLIQRGDIAGASFAFTTPKGGDHWSLRDGDPHRELLDVDLREITVTANPAYLDTEVAKRHLFSYRTPTRLQLAQYYLETV